MSDLRTLPVPEGLDGMRVDAGLAKLLGLSRTVVAELAESGDVLLDGRVAGKSDRLVAGVMLEVSLPAPAQPVQVLAIPVAGLIVLHEDDDVVVVNKPVGVAAHPSPGWTGPTVIGGLAAAGIRISTSGSADTSCPISSIGKIGVRSSGPAGCSVPGLSGGSGSPGRSGIRFTQWVGMRSSVSVNFVCSVTRRS